MSAASASSSGAEAPSSGHSEKRAPKFKSVSKGTLPYTFSFLGEIRGSQRVMELLAGDAEDKFELTFPKASLHSHAEVSIELLSWWLG